MAKQQQNITVKTEMITPAIAEQYLSTNRNNRPESVSTVARYAAAMKAGEWMMNGESIKFDVNGNLSDGQTRLSAVIASQTTVPMLVVRGIASKGFDTIDVGRKRQLWHVMARNGEPNATVLSAAIVFVHKYINKDARGLNGHTFLSHSQALKLIGNYPELRDSVRKVGSISKIMPKSMASGLHFLFSRSDKNLADVFFGKLLNGDGLSKGDCILLFRERLIANKSSQAKLSASFIAAIAIKTWNAFATGRKIGVLRWTEDESFPSIHGCDL